MGTFIRTEHRVMVTWVRQIFYYSGEHIVTITSGAGTYTL